MRLDRYDNSGFDRGRSRWVEGLWRLVEAAAFATGLPGSGWRVGLLRLFGARIGSGVVVKPNVRVKFPWKLSVGDHSWLGESVWIDNLETVSIGAHCCISQGAYLCTGNHRWDREGFDLQVAPITLEAQCWIGAMARVGPGSVCREGAVLTLGSVATGELTGWRIHSGNPAVEVERRPRPE